MLVNIGQPRHRPAGIAGKLLECHDRIRRLSSLSVRLATLEATDAEVQEVAGQLTRYFSSSLPLHARDEELSIRPRLLAAEPDGRLAVALEQMEREHHEHEQLLSQLIPAWSSLMTQPELLPGMRGALLPASERLQQAFTAHLELEESLVLPNLARLLTPALEQEIAHEMRSRRARPG